MAASNETPTEWAIRRLDEFIALTEKKYKPGPSNSIGFHRYYPAGPEDQVLESWPVVEKILAKSLPDWRDRVQPLDQDGFNRGYRWQQQREAAQQCRVLIATQEELERNLAPGPIPPASHLHPWVWDAAKSAWEAGMLKTRSMPRPAM